MIGTRVHVADVLEQREAAHAGHVEIEQDQVGALADDRVEAGLAVGHLLDLEGVGVAHRAEDAREGFPHLRLVVHHQHAPGRHRPASPATLPPREGRRGPPSAGRESARAGSSSQGAPT